MSKTVLIAIDNSKRELFGCSLLKQYLASMGIKSVLCSRWAFRDYFFHYLPDAIVWPNTLYDLSYFSQTSYIFALPSESGNGQPDQIKGTHSGTVTNPVYPENIDRFFCWGPAMKEILLDTGKWRDEQLVVTGSPATDHWLLPNPATKSEKTKIGITPTFRVLSCGTPPRKVNFFRWLDRVEISGGDGTYYSPPEHAESWIFFEASLVRVIMGLVREVAVTHAESVKIRPHPMEREDRYGYLRTITNGRTYITKKGTISEWLDDISILFTFISASALDAVVRGIPVVSLKGLLDPDALRKIPRDFHYCYEDMTWQMEDFGKVMEYVELAAKKELKPCKDEKRFNEFLTQHFSFPRELPAAHQIALEIKKVLDGESNLKRAKKACSRDRRSMKQIAYRYMPMFPQFKELLIYFNSFRPRSPDIGLPYLPWHIGERREAMQTANKVLSSIESYRP